MPSPWTTGRRHLSASGAPLPSTGPHEGGEASLVQVHRGDGQLPFTGRGAQAQAAASGLGQRVFGIEAAFGAQHVQPRQGMLGHEGLMGLRQHAALEFDEAHRAVFHRALGQAMGPRDGVDALGIAREQKAQQIGVVHQNVHHDPAPGTGCIQPPALQMGRQVDGMRDLHAVHAADLAGGDPVAHLLVAGRGSPGGGWWPAHGHAPAPAPPSPGHRPPTSPGASRTSRGSPHQALRGSGPRAVRWWS